MTEPKKNKGTKAAISPTKSILGDRRIRLLLSVIGAIIAWMAVTIVVQPGTTTTITKALNDKTISNNFDSMVTRNKITIFVSFNESTIANIVIQVV